MQPDLVTSCFVRVEPVKPKPQLHTHSATTYKVTPHRQYPSHYYFQQQSYKGVLFFKFQLNSTGTHLYYLFIKDSGKYMCNITFKISYKVGVSFKQENIIM